MDLRRPGSGWLCGCLWGVLACGGDTQPRHQPPPLGEVPPGETHDVEVAAHEMPGDAVLLPASPEAPPLVVSPLEGAFVALLEDALAQPEEARPYLRYVLGSREAGAAESEQEWLALLRLVNSVSLSPQVGAPVPLPELGAYRLDLRDYLWDRTLEVDGLTFRDGWQAIVQRSGLELPALAEEPLAAQTGTATAVLPLRAFLAAASSGAVYYALTGAPGFEEELQERLAARFPDPETEPVYNPAFGVGGRHTYQGARRLLLPNGRAYWQGLPNTPRGNSLLADPLDFNSWETDAIYPLPNGLPAFFLDTPYSGTTPAPLHQLQSSVTDASDQLVADCMACHSTGPLPTQDIFDEFVRDNGAYYDSDTTEFVTNEWPSQAELEAIIAADGEAYEGVLTRAGLSSESGMALQAITRAYAVGVGLTDMAAALHASEAQVRAVLPAGTTWLDAASFGPQFRSLLCQIHPDASAASGYCP